MLHIKKLLQRSIQYLLVIPGFRCAEGLAGEVSKVGGGEAGEDQLPGAESLIFQLKLPVGGVVAVLPHPGRQQVRQQQRQPGAEAQVSGPVRL